MTDTLSEFLLALSPADVERERSTSLAKARLESFGLPAHRFMVAVHSVRVAKLQGGIDPSWREDDDARMGPVRLDLARAEADHWRQRVTPTKPKPKPKAVPIKRMQPTRFTDTQLAVAMAALNGKKI